jgi:hypothetical protein
MRLRDKIDAWYERHEGLTALIYLAVCAIALACVPEIWRHAALKGFGFAFVGMLTRALLKGPKRS